MLVQLGGLQPGESDYSLRCGRTRQLIACLGRIRKSLFTCTSGVCVDEHHTELQNFLSGSNRSLSRVLYALPAWGGFLSVELIYKINSLFKRLLQFGYISDRI